MSRRTSDSGDLLSRNERVMRRSSSCSSEKAKFMGSLRVVRMRPPGRWAVTFYRAFRTSARRSVYARVRSLSMEQIGARELRANLAAALRQAGAGERVVVDRKSVV